MAGASFGAGWVLCALPALAADGDLDPFSLAPEQLFNATVVTASRRPEPLRDTPAAVFVISNEDIARSGATSIPEALRMAPGVDVARVGAASWAISIRGFNGALANKLLVLVDGREIYDPLFSGVYWDALNIPLGDIERIEVVRGPGGAVWGANAVNGVINIITKDASQTQGGALSATLANNSAGASARYGGALGEAAHWRAFATYAQTDASPTPAHLNANDASSASRVGARFDWRPSERDTLTFEGELYRTSSGDLRNVPLLSAPYEVLTPESLDAWGSDVLAHWEHRGEAGTLSIQSFINYDRRDRLTLDDERTTFDIDAQYTLAPIAGHALAFGLGFRETIDRPDATTIIVPESGRVAEQRLSGFVQDRIALGASGWALTLGSKIENSDFGGVRSEPTARLQWADENQTLWAAVSRAWRAPSELERRYTILLSVIPPGMLPVPVAVQLTPTHSFDGEDLVAYEAGYRRQLSPTAAIDIDAFYNDYDGLATNVLLAPQLVFSPTFHVVLPIGTASASEARSYGLEALVTWRPRPDLDLEASYSFLDLDMEGPPSTVAIDAEAAEGQSPRHQFGLRAHWNASSRVNVDASIAYVDGLDAYGVGDYTRFDLRWAYRLNDTAQFELVGQNLFSASHREFGAASDPASTLIEPSVFARLTWRG